MQVVDHVIDLINASPKEYPARSLGALICKRNHLLSLRKSLLAQIEDNPQVLSKIESYGKINKKKLEQKSTFEEFLLEIPAPEDFKQLLRRYYAIEKVLLATRSQCLQR